MAEGQVADGSHCLYAGQRLQPGEEISEEFNRLWVVIARIELNVQSDRGLRETGVNLFNVDVAAKEEARRGQQDDDQCGFGDNETALQTCMRAGDAVAAGRGKKVRQIDSRHSQCGQNAGEYAGQQRHGDGEKQDACI